MIMYHFLRISLHYSKSGIGDYRIISSLLYMCDGVTEKKILLHSNFISTYHRMASVEHTPLHSPHYIIKSDNRNVPYYH